MCVCVFFLRRISNEKNVIFNAKVIQMKRNERTTESKKKIVYKNKISLRIRVISILLNKLK